MAVHRFAVNVPNPTARSAAVQLRLERAKSADLTALALDVPQAELGIVSAVITLDPCGEEGRERLQLELEPRSSVDVHVVVVTAPSDPRIGGSAAFHLIDERMGKVAGGVMVACFDRPGPEPGSQVIGTPDPCPVVLAANPYPIAPGDDPSRQPADRAFPLRTDVELVAPVVNPTAGKLEDVQVYLEHLGQSDAQFTPTTWNVGTLAAKDVFYAVWPLRALGSTPGVFEASIVVASARTNPVRLAARIQVGHRDRSPREPR